MTSPKVSTFHTIDHCRSDNLSAATIIADLDGTLLRSRSSFPYFALIAFETGGPLRLLLLLLTSPLIALLYNFISESAGIQVLIFVTLAGTKLSTIKSVARAVLPKFYAADVHPETWRVFSAGHRRCVVTANPTVMVEPFLKECLGVEEVMGTKLATFWGRATGFVRCPGVVVGEKKAEEVKRVFGDRAAPDIGIGGRRSDFAFMRLCKEGYLVQATTPKFQPVRPENLPKPIIFHDGRLVEKPTPLLALLTVLWIPAAFLLACLRVASTSLLPIRFISYSLSALGVHLIVNGTPPPPPSSSSSGVLFICCHRTLLDPVFLSAVLRRPVSTVTYSLSRLSEFLSPIKTVRLTRNRAADAAIIRRLLARGDVAICPEGTTCRESFLLRFSALFAELADDIVPVAVVNKMSMFHGTTVRGWKAMDPFYFFMNPSPVYEFTFLDKLPRELTCAGGRESHEVANYVQKVIAARLGYKCTSLTRKDKYMALAENDGTVVENGHVGKK